MGNLLSTHMEDHTNHKIVDSPDEITLYGMGNGFLPRGMEKNSKQGDKTHSTRAQQPKPQLYKPGHAVG